MSVETAGAIGAAVAAPTASIGSGIGTEISSVSSVGPSTGSEFSQSFSNIPGPDIPSSIITEISRPAGMDFESLPEPLVGDFDIHDIIAKPFAEETISHSFQTQIEPATFLDPKIVEEIYAIPTTGKESLAELTDQPTAEPSVFENDPIGPAEAIVDEALAPFTKSDLKYHIKPTDLAPATIPTPIEQGVGDLATEIITLGAIETVAQPNIEPEEIPQTETQADVQALEGALTLLETSDFTQEEKALWKTKLEKAVEPQAIAKIQKEIETQVETETQSAVETETEAETETTTAGGTQPPDLPTAENGEFEMEKPEDKAEEEEEEPEWNIYHIQDKWQTADEINKRRLELAEAIASRATEKKGTKSSVESAILALDIPNFEESIQILRGKLKMPVVTPGIYFKLSFAESPKEVRDAVVETVKNVKSKEAKPIVMATEVLKESKLSDEIKNLAKKGHTEVVWKNNWRPGRVVFQNPFEAKKLQQKKAS